MARMIPPVYDTESTPPGEVDVFNKLKDHAPANWVVLHSFDLPQHIRQQQGEMDFVVVIPETGVVCLEVKSHQSVRRQANGMWVLGSSDPEPRGPFKQANEAMHSLRQRITKRSPELRDVPFVETVVFTHCTFDVEAIEWERWQVIDEPSIRVNGLATMVERTIRSQREKLRNTPSARGWFNEGNRAPTDSQLEAIVRIMRPRVEMAQSPKSRRTRAAGEMKKFTEEQYTALDANWRNSRVVYSGAAGVGKTFLAMEQARRSASQGKSVILCCYNRLLGEWLKSEMEPEGAGISVGTFHSLLAKLFQIDIPSEPSNKFFAEELPEKAFAALADGSPHYQAFDEIIVDEAQDLCTKVYLDLFDLLLKGGLKDGNFKFFGDFDHQLIFGSVDGRDYLSELTSYSNFELMTNCRNRPRIGSLAAGLFETESYRRFLRPDDNVEADWISFDSHETQISELTAILERIRNEGYESSEIAILSSISDESGAAHTALPSSLRQRLSPARNPGIGKSRTSTIQAFKGLEARVVIVTDIANIRSSEEVHLFYTAITRATDRLFVLVDADAVPDLLEIMTRRNSND